MLKLRLSHRDADLLRRGQTLTPRARTIDALVMASASQRPNEIVYTSDPKDLQMLRDHVPQFKTIRIERI